MFGKNKKAKECVHKYKDFPWFTCTKKYYSPNGDSGYEVRIVEPYVCIHCGNRVDKILSSYGGFTYKTDADKAADKLALQYSDYIKDKCIVEDMVNDLVLVDKQYLKYYEMVKNGKIELPKLELK